MSEQLKNCPWCGHPAVRCETTHAYGHKMYYVRCSNDNCPIGPSTDAYKTKGADVRAWNRREE